MAENIIIDGVDVSGCKHYKNRNCIADYCLTDMPFSEAKCELNTNCYYKQLKRKEQECFKLQTTANAYNYLVKLANYRLDKIEDLQQQLDQLKAEKEEFKQTLIEIQQDLEFATYCESQECGCDDPNECLECTKKQIIQKISEVKND